MDQADLQIFILNSPHLLLLSFWISIEAKAKLIDKHFMKLFMDLNGNTEIRFMISFVITRKSLVPLTQMSMTEKKADMLLLKNYILFKRVWIWVIMNIKKTHTLSQWLLMLCTLGVLQYVSNTEFTLTYTVRLLWISELISIFHTSTGWWNLKT